MMNNDNNAQIINCIIIMFRINHIRSLTSDTFHIVVYLILSSNHLRSDFVIFVDSNYSLNNILTDR